MKLMEPGAWFGFTIAICLAGVGCVVDSTAPGYAYCPTQQSCVAGGDVLLSWSIDGDGSGALCASHDAAQIEVTITDATGQTIDDWPVPCVAGPTDETLPPGVYTATAQLQDASGHPITTADPAQVAIYAGASSAPLDFDFEENSFTNGT
jgi:hypothetical protein